VSFKKNTAVTGFSVGLASSADGSDITTGTPVGYYTLDGGVQSAIADTTPVHEGNGLWSFDLLASEMNGDIVALTFTHASAISAHFTIKTDTKITSDLNDIAATSIVSSGPITTASGAVSTITNLTNLPSIPTNWLTATGIAAGALNGKGNWNVGKTGYSLTQTFPTNFADLSITLTTGLVNITQAAADKAWSTAARTLTANTNLNDPTVAAISDQVWDEIIAGHAIAGSTGEALSAAGGAGDPWITTLPGSYTAGQAGKIVGDNINATIASRMAEASINTTAGAVDNVTLVATTTTNTDMRGTDSANTIAPDNTSIANILTDTGTTIPTQITALNDFNPATTGVDVTKINGSAEAASDLALSAATIVAASAITGTLSTTQMTTDLTEATNDHYNGRIVIWTSGVLQDQATDITAYNGTTKLVTYTATTEAPSNADTFVIV